MALPSFPLELVTLLGSSLIGGIMQISSRAMEARSRERTYFLQALNAEASIISEARACDNAGFAWTRRTIALLAVFFIIAFPKLVAVFAPQVAVHIGYSEWSGGFLGFGDGREKVLWHSLTGLVITPLDTHLLSAIVGLYFGGSLTKR
ncbi:MAG: hypothetical protein E1N59_2284 [Puniceicoccaceae bacterium 5H]|nr:MAG: hypothetical protein E1N59_2284 [Puniceicoccaceae bacterium 5H]